MFAIPGQDPITLTTAAKSQIKALVDNGQALRIGLKKGGCAGMEYTMDIVKDAGEHEILVEQDGARVIIAASAQLYLIGMEIDYEDGLMEAGFRFNNPNVTEACGCGESVSFTVDELAAKTPEGVPILRD